MTILNPEHGDWEGLSGGLDWQWGSNMDTTSEWKIWNYSSKGNEWKEGKYLVLVGQSNSGSDDFIFTDEIELSGAATLASSVFAVSLGVLALM